MAVLYPSPSHVLSRSVIKGLHWEHLIFQNLLTNLAKRPLLFINKTPATKN